MNDKNKNILLAVLIVGVLGMTVAFAALSTTLNISATANVAETRWNIHFRNWQLDTNPTVTYGGNTHQNTAVYPTVSQLSQSLAPNVTKVDNLNVTLNQPGDYAKYNFEIINEGTIDASLDSFTYPLTCASGNDCSHVSYEVKCFENSTRTGTEFKGASTLAKNGGVTYCYLEVKYKDQTNPNSGTPGEEQIYTKEAASATLGVNFVFVQEGNNSYSYQINEGTSSSIPTTKYYLQTSTTTGNKEVCGVFPSGTVCMTSSYYNPNYTSNYQSDFTNCSSGSNVSCLTGYMKEKADEMASNGASCNVYSSGVYCYGTGMYCYIHNNGNVRCYEGSRYCGISNSGGTGCH